MFTQTNFTENALGKLKFSDVHEQSYISFCRRVGHSPESKKSFSQRLSQLGYQIKPGSKNQKYIIGVDLKKINLIVPKFVFEDIEEF